MASENPYRVGAEVNEAILVTTGNEIEGHRIERYLGVVRGIVVRSPSIGKAFLGAFKQLAGGNIKEYIDVCEPARHDAYERMLAARARDRRQRHHRHALRRDRVHAGRDRGARLRHGRHRQQDLAARSNDSTHLVAPLAPPDRLGLGPRLGSAQPSLRRAERGARRGFR